MSGKSTYIRQAAILTILAQIGSFVPAKFARIGIVDRIFTRIGISDDIAGGRSTFMVEMVETASILNQATSRSLAILDEIGRGTSTYDGLAIARSVAEFIHNSPALGCKTLFATHYHEMTELGETLPRANNLRVAVAEEGDTIQFLYRIVQGGADRSYGIHVAQLAGMPAPVVERARELLTELENHSNNTLTATPASDHHQLDLFNTPNNNTDFLRSISQLDTDNLTPIEALNRLYELKESAKQRNSTNRVPPRERGKCQVAPTSWGNCPKDKGGAYNGSFGTYTDHTQYVYVFCITYRSQCKEKSQSLLTKS